MADFTAAFRKGLDAFKIREQGKLEVTEILRDFKKQLYFATDRQVVLIEVPIPPSLDETGSNPSDVQPVALIASLPGNKNPDPRLTVLEYSVAPSGYPVHIASADFSVDCETREDFELALARALENPLNAGKIFEVMTGAKDQPNLPPSAPSASASAMAIGAAPGISVRTGPVRR